MSRGTRPVVLLGFAEALAAIETSWMLLDAGFEVATFSRSSVRPAVARDQRIHNYAITSPQDDVEATCASLSKLVAEVNPSVVLPLDDDALWLCDRLWDAEEGLPPLAGPRRALARLAIDKTQQLRLAEAVGLSVPTTVVCCPGKPIDLDKLPSSEQWIVKPVLAASVRDGRMRRGVPRRVDERDKLVELASAAEEPVLIQPVLQGIGEGLFGFAHEGGVSGWSAHRRIRTKDPGGSGSSACRSIDVDITLLERAGRLIAQAGWRGIFMLEFLRDDAGTAWWMELNGRTWGSMVLARHRGVPYPVWAVRQALDPRFVPPEPPQAPHVVARHVGRELLHLAAVLRGPPDEVTGASWPSRWEALRALTIWRRGERLYNFRRDHKRVFFADTWQTVASALPRRLRRRHR